MAQTTPFEYDLEVLPKSKLGIDPRVIEMLLEEAKTEWTAMEAGYLQQIAEMKGRLETLEAERSVVHTVLISAQKSAADTLQKAQSEAETLLEDGRAKAKEEEAERQHRLQTLQEEVSKYTQMKSAVTQDIRAMLEGYLRDLDHNLAQKLEANQPPITEAPYVTHANPVQSTGADQNAPNESDMIAAHGFGEG